MIKTKINPKKGPVRGRHSLALALGAIIMAAPGAALAQDGGITIEGQFNSGGSFSDASTDLKDIADKANSQAANGIQDNDLKVTVTIKADVPLGTAPSEGSNVMPPPADLAIFNGSDGLTTKGFKDVTITGNVGVDSASATLDGTGRSTGTMLGIENVSGDISVSNLNFINGYGGESAPVPYVVYGGTLLILPNTATGASSAFNNATLANVVFQGNQSYGTNGAASGGGGLLMGNHTDMTNPNHGTLVMSDVMFINNSVSSQQDGSGLHNASIGGGAFVSDMSHIAYNNGVVWGNSALAVDGEFADGGGLAFDSAGAFDLDVSNVDFNNNKAQVSGVSVSGDNFARGGGIYAENYGYGSGTSDVAKATFDAATSFTGNQALASNSGAGQAEAFGGAAAFVGNMDAAFNGVNFTDNVARGDDGSYGGAIYSQASVALTNSSLTGNQAVGSNGLGGAIFMDTGVDTNALVTDSVLDMTVTAGKTVSVSGNTAGGQASGVYFGSSDGLVQSEKNGQFNINNEGRLAMLDPLTVNLDNNKTFNMDIRGDGSMTWGGANSVAAGGGTTLSLTDNALHLARDFSLAVAGGSFSLDIDNNSAPKTALSFDPSRNQNQAMFDLNGVTGASTFNVVAGSTTMTVVNTERQLVDFHRNYLAVDGVTTAEANTIMAELNNIDLGGYISGSYTVNGSDQVVMAVDYTSPYAGTLKRAGTNTVAAASALTDYLQYAEVSDRDVSIIHRNLNVVSPEYGVVAGTMGSHVTQTISRTAVSQGLRGQHNSSLPTPLSVQPAYGMADEGPRVWAGYAGSFRNVDNSDGYYGYDQNTHAAMLGLSYDLGPEASIGIYGGVSSTKADMNNIRSQVESDGTHIGVVGRFTPMADVDPNLAVYVDAGYANYDNDGYRSFGSNKTKGSFDQDAYTVGLGVEYAVPVDYGVLVTPSLDLRYTKLEQDSYREHGGLTAARVKGYDVNSFTSNMALSVSKEFAFNGGTVTPSARLGWNHEYGDNDIKTTANYIAPDGSGGLIPNTYRVGTVERNRDSMDAGVGLRALLDSGSYGGEIGVNLSYDANISKDTDTHSVYGGLDYRF